MSTAKRSRSTSNVLRLDAGKKERTPPAKPKPPEPAPLIPCLKVKVVIGDVTTWVGVANYPAEGGLDAFYDLIHRAPDDCFMTSDAGGTLSFSSIVAIRRPKDDGEEYPVKVEASPPGEPRRLYERLRVKIGAGRGEVVDVANVPWTENGLAHFALVIGKHRRCDFITADFGFLPVRGVRREDLKMPGQPEDPPREKLRPEDIASADDYPE